jgi:hypothetical protein
MRIWHALKSLRRTPWYATSAIAVLSVAIGLGTVVFAVVDGLLFKSLPYRTPEDLSVLRAEAGALPSKDLSPVAWKEIERWTNAIPEAGWTAVGARVAEFPWDGVAYKMAMVDERFFQVMGIRPALGGFVPSDFDQTLPGSRPVLISHRVWRRALGSDPGAVGRTVLVSERRNQAFGVRIAGVLPADFVYPIDSGDQQPDLLAPVTRESRARGDRAFQLIVRIPESVNEDSVRVRLATATRDLAALKMPADPHVPDRAHTNFDRVTLDPIGLFLASRVRPAFRLTFIAASILLLAACLNVAALAAVRSVGRQRDILIRRALGATRWELAKGHLIATSAQPTLTSSSRPPPHFSAATRASRRAPSPPFSRHFCSGSIHAPRSFRKVGRRLPTSMSDG